MLAEVLRVMLAFLLKKRAEYRRYWIDFIVGLCIKFIFFLGTLYARPIQDGNEAVTRIFGFSLWYLSAHLVAKLGNSALEEAYLGTVEQVLSTRARTWQLLLGLIVSEICFSLIWVSTFVGMALAIVGIGTFWSGVKQTALIAIAYGLVGLLGMVGVGLVMLGMSLRFKRVGAITEVVLYYLLVFSGFFLPPRFIPETFHFFNLMSPLAWFVKGMLNGGNGIAYASLVSALWLLLGVVVLKSQWNWARRTGRLSSYV